MVPGEREEGRGHGFPLFLLGLLIGIAGTVVVPRVLGPRLPGALRTGNLMEGRVLAKLLDGDRLLLKVQADGNVYLATFENRQKEIDLLVDPGDLVTLQVQGTDPFPVGPAIRGVRKPEPSAAPPTVAEPHETEGADEESQVPPAPARPDSASPKL